ncbi:excalibur calcium-binding domain-containing protein [Streptomyces sp. NPDC020403]|uniref:excalibur calcium-binding domain-containing protein n=1 Tax=unclassified Streptomyces TaxID=2593676 RepID=UPI0033D19B47
MSGCGSSGDQERRDCRRRRTARSEPDAGDRSTDSAGGHQPLIPPGPPAGVPDVDCSDLPGPVWVGPSDPHRLDRDGDGIGCELD